MLDFYILQEYCPLCFRGSIGVSRGLRVSRDSKRIDRVQALHARENGLRVLDITSPGDFCPFRRGCRLACLVCNETIIDGGESEFKKLRDRICCHGDAPDSDSDSEVEMGKNQGNDNDFIANNRKRLDFIIVNEKLKSRGAVWIDRWNTPIHRDCAEYLSCGCLVPRGCTECREHDVVIGAFFRKAPNPPPAVAVISSSSELNAAAAVKKIGSCVPMRIVRIKAVGFAKEQDPAMKRASYKPVTSHKVIAKPAQSAKPGGRKPVVVQSNTLDFFMGQRDSVPAPSAMPVKGFNLKAHTNGFDTEKHGFVRFFLQNISSDICMSLISHFF